MRFTKEDLVEAGGDVALVVNRLSAAGAEVSVGLVQCRAGSAVSMHVQALRVL